MFQKAQNIVVYTDRKEYRNFDKSVKVQKIRERFFFVKIRELIQQSAAVRGGHSRGSVSRIILPGIGYC